MAISYKFRFSLQFLKYETIVRTNWITHVKDLLDNLIPDITNVSGQNLLDHVPRR